MGLLLNIRLRVETQPSDLWMPDVRIWPWLFSNSGVGCQALLFLS